MLDKPQEYDRLLKPVRKDWDWDAPDDEDDIYLCECCSREWAG